MMTLLYIALAVLAAFCVFSLGYVVGADRERRR